MIKEKKYITQGKNRNVTLPIISWMGGKRRLAEDIIPIIEEQKHDNYVELFTGGGAIFFMKQPSKCEIINDVNSELINLYKVVKYHIDEFEKEIRWLLKSREEFRLQRLSENKTLTDIQKAAKFYYLNKTSFASRGVSYGFETNKKPVWNILNLQEQLTEAHIRLSHAHIENLDWRKLYEKTNKDNTLMYLDPPYWQLTGYNVEFAWSEYETIAKYMSESKAKMILSINKHSDINKLFKQFNKKEVGIQYTTNKEKPLHAKELIIWNW